MDLHNTQSCVFQEISGISYRSPEQTLAEFCKRGLENGVRYHSAIGAKHQLYPLYIFSAGVAGKDRKERSDNYGIRLASYIRANKLGKILGSPIVENKAFHPGRYGAVWIWAPDVNALTAWWKVNKGVR